MFPYSWMYVQLNSIHVLLQQYTMNASHTKRGCVRHWIIPRNEAVSALSRVLHKYTAVASVMQYWTLNTLAILKVCLSYVTVQTMDYPSSMLGSTQSEASWCQTCWCLLGPHYQAKGNISTGRRRVRQYFLSGVVLRKRLPAGLNFANKGQWWQALQIKMKFTAVYQIYSEQLLI